MLLERFESDIISVWVMNILYNKNGGEELGAKKNTFYVFYY